MYVLQSFPFFGNSPIVRSDEKNDKSKELIAKKIEEYLARAETLKGHIQAGEKRPKKPIGVDNSVNGASSGESKCVVRSSLYHPLTGVTAGKKTTEIQKSRNSGMALRVPFFLRDLMSNGMMLQDSKAPKPL